MKIGAREYTVTPMPAGADGFTRPAVRLEVRQFGMAFSEQIAPQQAREFAALLLAAANDSERKG